jgi:hypothetical protein
MHGAVLAARRGLSPIDQRWAARSLVARAPARRRSLPGRAFRPFTDPAARATVWHVY